MIEKIDKIAKIKIAENTFKNLISIGINIVTIIIAKRLKG